MSSEHTPEHLTIKLVDRECTGDSSGTLASNPKYTLFPPKVCIHHFSAVRIANKVHSTMHHATAAPVSIARPRPLR